MSDYTPTPTGARGYSWPTATENNTIALRHGAWSPRRVDPLATEFVDHVLAEANEPGSSTAYLAAASFRPALWAYARIEARIQLLVEFIDARGGDIDDDDEIRPASNLLTTLERQALTHRGRLGLDVLSRARLGADLAASQVDMARLMAALTKAEQADAAASEPITTTGTDDANDEGDDE